MIAQDLYIHIFQTTFQLDDAFDYNTLKYQSIQAWDSIGHLTLISNIEQAFNIIFEMDDIIEFSSFEKGKQLLHKYDVEL